MRTIILLLGMALATLTTVKAQGNLQFNRVVNIEITATPQPGGFPQYYVQTGTQTVVVPPGKVLKLESIDASVTKGTFNSNSESSLHSGQIGLPVVYLNNVMILGSTNTTQAHHPHMIRWLPEGTHTIELWFPRVNPVVTFTVTAFLTAIEFNIVP